MLKRKLPKTKENKQLIDSLFTKHPKGFYVRATDRVKSKEEIVRYIGRYIRHPAIAESRIDSYNGKEVTFHYTDHENTKQVVKMSVDEFISAVIGHIPDRHFKVIRYYGFYARQDRKKYRHIVGEDSSYGTITQTSILKFMGKHIQKCHECGNVMEFIEYQKRKPPDSEKFGDKITDWAYIR
jgi:Putative transposase